LTSPAPKLQLKDPFWRHNKSRGLSRSSYLYLT